MPFTVLSVILPANKHHFQCLHVTPLFMWFALPQGYYEKYYRLPYESSILRTYYVFNLGFMEANKETGNVKGVSFHN